MHAEIRTAQQSRSTSKECGAHRATPDALDLLEQFGSTVLVPRDGEILDRVSQQSFAGEFFLAASAPLGPWRMDGVRSRSSSGRVTSWAWRIWTFTTSTSRPSRM